MPISARVQEYVAFQYPNAGNPRGRINLYCSNDYKLYLLFYDDSEPLPANAYLEDYKIGRGFAPYSRYANYIDLLRNEEPIFVVLREDEDPPRFVVYCGKEEPGEGEL